MAEEAILVANDENDTGSSSIVANEEYYYFGYGPMVHPMVRERRGIRVVEEQPAVLRDYRLTFALAGVAAVVRARGFDVHGVVMKCASREDWERLKSGESAGFFATLEDVHIYSSQNNHDDQEDYSVLPEEQDEEEEETATGRLIKAHVFHMVEFDESKLDAPIEKLPQERYLKLIASGMQLYNCSSDYINENIWAVPFVPQRKPKNYLTFPIWTPHKDDNKKLPKISYACYEEMAQEQKEQNRLFFLCGTKIVFVYNPNDHPVAAFLEQFGVGKPDMSFQSNQFVVDPDIPWCKTPQNLTPEVIEWAENDMCEVTMETGGLAAHHVMDLTMQNGEEEEEEEEISESDLVVFLEQLREELATQTAADEDTMDSTTASQQSESLDLEGMEERLQEIAREVQPQPPKGRRKSRLSGVFKRLSLANPKLKDKSDGSSNPKPKRRTTWAPSLRLSQKAGGAPSK